MVISHLICFLTEVIERFGGHVQMVMSGKLPYQIDQEEEAARTAQIERYVRDSMTCRLDFRMSPKNGLMIKMAALLLQIFCHIQIRDIGGVANNAVMNGKHLRTIVALAKAAHNVLTVH